MTQQGREIKRKKRKKEKKRKKKERRKKERKKKKNKERRKRRIVGEIENIKGKKERFIIRLLNSFPVMLIFLPLDTEREEKGKEVIKRKRRVIDKYQEIWKNLNKV